MAGGLASSGKSPGARFQRGIHLINKRVNFLLVIKKIMILY
jgi:hypothetical protein